MKDDAGGEWIDLVSSTLKNPAKFRGVSKYQVERNFILKRDGYKCLKCGATENLTIDHVKPTSKGGRNTRANKQTLCFKCNGEKDNTEIDYR